MEKQIVESSPLKSIVVAPPSREILEWLSPLTFNHKHEEVFSQLQTGTGEWLLEDEVFQEWLGSRSVLLCHGMPGAGKTTLASLVVNECLKKQNDSNGTIGLVYVYCEYNHDQNQTITNLIGAILRQLENLVTIEPDLEEIYAQHSNGPYPPPSLPLATMIGRIKSCLAKFTTVYLILDALDECSVRDELLNDYVAELLASDNDKILKIFATSRPLPELVNINFAIHGTDDPPLNISARDEDIKLYLEGRLEHYERLRKPLSMVLAHSVEGRRILLERICEQACGLFLVARLLIESLVLVPDRTTLLMCLEKLPKGLDATYEMTIDRIKCSQSESSWSMAQKAFMWVTYSMVPLRISQLLEAVASEPSSASFDSRSMTDQETLLSACGGLLQVISRDSDPHRSQRVEFIHRSTKEYFIKNSGLLLSGGEAGNPEIDTVQKEIHTQIALICLNYLIIDKISQREERAVRDCVVDDSSPRLDDYSIGFWGLHAIKANQSKIIPVLHSLLASPDLDPNTARQPDGNTALLVALTHNQSNLSDSERHQLHKLQTLMVSTLLTRQDLDLNKPNSRGMTPLHAAIDVENADVVETLLTYRTVNPNQATYTGETPLRTALLRLDNACDKKNEQSVVDNLRIFNCLLAREDVDLNLTVHEDGIPPLHLALTEAINIHCSTHLETEDTALVPINPPPHPEINSSPTDAQSNTEDKTIDINNAPANNTETLLSRFLTRTDLDVNKPNRTGETALMLAVSRGQELNVELLLSRHDIDINKADNNGKTAFDYAKEKGNDEVIALLSQKAME